MMGTMARKKPTIKLAKLTVFGRDMSKMSLNLSPEVLAGLQAESRRRGVGIPTVIRDALSKAMEKQPPQDGTGGKP
jgi:hypothetical protein